jgi:hypothetical protein
MATETEANMGPSRPAFRSSEKRQSTGFVMPTETQDGLPCPRTKKDARVSL